MTKPLYKPHRAFVSIQRGIVPHNRRNAVHGLGNTVEPTSTKMPYKVSISKGGRLLKEVEKPTSEEAVTLFTKWYNEATERITQLMGYNGYVQYEFRHPLSYALKPTYYTTCKIPVEERSEREEYVLAYTETA